MTEKFFEWLGEYSMGDDIKDNRPLASLVSQFRILILIILFIALLSFLLFTMYYISIYLGFFKSSLVFIFALFLFPFVNFIKWNRAQNKNQTQRKEQENGNQNL